MNPLKKPFAKSKDVLWEKLYSELDGEYRFPPKEDFIRYEPVEKARNEGIPLESPINVFEVQCENWKLHLSLSPGSVDYDDSGGFIPLGFL